MSGWFGVNDEDFIQESVVECLNMDLNERLDWLEDSWFNLRRYCHVPEDVILGALEEGL